ncbi:MAG: DNA repair protein RadA [Eubacteriales bacterium]|nr:DNA repair protein RadA [Eubacteriales bacterium]
MAKKSKFFCNECGYESSGWLGRCPSCGTWNSFVEESLPKSKKSATPSARAWLDELVDEDESEKGHGETRAIELSEVDLQVERRVSSGISELDSVLGGGFVEGSLVLLGGEPGIGKSTLLMQVCENADFEMPYLYVCGEESSSQIKLRAERLGIQRRGIRLLPEILFERIAEVIVALKCKFCIIDSIQTLYSEALSAAPGSVSQVREVTAGLLRLAKRLNCCIVLVGHVTKDGSLAGPRVLEHMVDCVLSFDGESGEELRSIRATKNRFGATNALGLFRMTGEGLLPIEDASAALLSGRPQSLPGSAITCTLEGKRPLLIEVQALLNRSVFGAGQRMTQGFDRSRLGLLLALLEKQFHLDLGNYDAFINLIGGIRISETAIDLAVLAALLSTYKEVPLREKTVLIGEVGLTGESRRVQGIVERVQEVSKYDFDQVIVPSACRRGLEKLHEKPCKILYLDHIRELPDLALIEKN